MMKMVRRLGGSLILLLAFHSLAAAQRVGAVVTGIVSDPSGAVIASAEVTVTEINQGSSRTVRTNEAGVYVIPELSPGSYRVAVRAPGFKTAVRHGLSLQVDQTARVDFQLQLGAVVESVEVTGSNVMLNTDDSVVGQVIENRHVVELPLNSRNYLELAQLTVGVTPATESRTQDAGSFSALGQHSYQMSVILDGVDNSSRLSGGQVGRETQAVTPSVDSVREFKIVTNNNSAEYGFRMGGSVVVSTKSGTNQFHGSVYEFLRNDKLDAANFFAVGQPKPPYRRNEYGGTLGGPVLKNRTFFFAGYNGRKTREAQATLSTVPLRAQLEGNFSAQPPIFDPLTTTTSGGRTVRTQFAGNQVPRSRFDPVAAKVATLYPAPNLPGTANNFYFPASNSDDPKQMDTRVDHVLTDKHRPFVRYSRRWKDAVTPGPLPLPADGNAWSVLQLQGNSLVASLNSTLTPTLNNDVRFGYSTLLTFGATPTRDNLIAQFGITGLTDFGEYNSVGLTPFIVTGYSSLGSKASNRNNLHLFQVSDSLMLVRGRHTIKAGASFIREAMFRRASKASRGQFTFDGSYTQNPSSRATTGDGVADLLMGTAHRVVLSTPVGENIVAPNYSAFLQDDWRASSKLTLNLGVRWDVFFPPTYPGSQVNVFRFTPGTQNYQIVYPKDSGDCGCVINWRNFAPRLGLAYQVRAHTVVRSGFGIYYGQPDGIGDLGGRFFNQAPLAGQISLTGDRLTKPAGQVSAGFPPGQWGTGTVAQNASVNTSYPYRPTQYSNQWFADVQQELGRNSVLTLSYLGSQSHHLDYPKIDLNQPQPGPGSISSRSPYPYLSSITLNGAVGNANYNALAAKFERRFSKGLMALCSYTWSHAIDNVAENLTLATGQAPQNYFDLKSQRGNSVFDVRHRLVTSVVYELPVGHGRTFLNHKGWADYILGGWQLASIVNLYTGTPFTPILSTDIANTGTTNHPNRVAGGTLSSDARNINRWFDLSAFVVPAAFTYGNSGRNILVGPGTRNLDVKLGKSFVFAERWRLEFRTELFNALNTPNFDLPAPQVDLAQGGQITSAKAAREIQFGLKLLF